VSFDPIALQVLAGGMRSVCDEMGVTLIQASHSPNIKERRDCSTALFNARGELVMQAEHIPVHLGSMPDAVAAVLGEAAERGTSWVLNDPFAGGTHLPDITLITPVFDNAGLLGFAANRAHHADVGGPVPASMPAHSTTLSDEGIVIPPTRVAAVKDLEAVAEGMRNPLQRRADLRAQWAANRVGARGMSALAARRGAASMRAGMDEILAYAERRTRAALSGLPDGEWTAEDRLEGGADGSQDITIAVRAQIAGDRLELDFTGSATQVAGNLNCPLPVTRAAAYFAVRALLDPDAPASAGANRPVEVIAPEGSILNARAPAAVAAGNVETSSRVADVVLAALAEAAGGPAQGQGTMNSLTLAGAGWTYYETLGGGQGACEGADGPSGVHVAMSNTLNTPVEALESELPLRVRELSVRRGSGGAGRFRGGDGLVREIEALEPATFTLITERRRIAPRGRAGGADGARGRNLANGEELASKAEGSLSQGGILRIETPGGGGYGAG
jgi:N-methylhydantoinase B